jgi:endonuclease YncB( thermonuclease family)
MNKLRALILSAILTALIALALNFGSANDNWEEDQILRVIDGDTIELVSGKTIRLANINTPEKNKPGYLEAKKFLASYENSSVLIQVIESDRYDRLSAA